MLFNRLTGAIQVPNVVFLILLVSGALFSSATYAAKKAPVTSASEAALSPELEQRLANIERLLKSNGLLDMLQQIELLQQEVAQLRGEIEVSNHSLEQLKKRQRDLYTDLDRRLQSIEQSSSSQGSSLQGTTTLPISENPPLETLGEIETVNPPENDAKVATLTIEQTTETATVDPQTQELAEKVVEQTPTTTETTEDNQTSAEEIDPVQIQAQYQQAFKLLKQSQYDQAIKAFANFVKTHPDSQYSDNAQYWMAEALYVKRQYEDAIGAYNHLISNYPDSQKVPHGLLKIGYSYQELGDAEKAKLWYTDVRQRFPGTTASRLADDRLKHINDS